MKTIHLPYGNTSLELGVPSRADVLAPTQAPAAIAQPHRAVLDSLASPIGCPPLQTLIKQNKPETVAITVSDITRPVPNAVFLPAMLDVLNHSGITDSRIVIIVGTGMHRASTMQEREKLVGKEVLQRVEVIDHVADDPSSLARISEDPPVSVCRRFAAADFRIVTGFIEPHFMAGFSGGRKGVCPALVDLGTVQRFHGYDALSDPRAEIGNLAQNPCHNIALEIARAVGVDFLFNVAITHDRRIAGIYCGDLELAHKAGCRDVAKWTTAKINGAYDLVVTTAGGSPLDHTFYQAVKGMCAALPALKEGSTLLQVAGCCDGVGSRAYVDLMLRWKNNWKGFLRDIEENRRVTALDQWEFQMQCRVLERIGVENLWFVSDGIDIPLQKLLCINPVQHAGDAKERAQWAIVEYIMRHPHAAIAVIPAGPYTMLKT
ncbi:MAG: nickel-dependent lactate racemase [Planctomycetes bacterium]|nr:nickel-dependent lactate racemase [Planctomycetota bacterium]